jgi:hypothetical protein
MDWSCSRQRVYGVQSARGVQQGRTGTCLATVGSPRPHRMTIRRRRSEHGHHDGGNRKGPRACHHVDDARFFRAFFSSPSSIMKAFQVHDILATCTTWTAVLVGLAHRSSAYFIDPLSCNPTQADVIQKAVDGAFFLAFQAHNFLLLGEAMGEEEKNLATLILGPNFLDTQGAAAFTRNGWPMLTGALIQTCSTSLRMAPPRSDRWPATNIDCTAAPAISCRELMRKTGGYMDGI